MFRVSEQSVPFTLLGCAFTHEGSAISGDTRVRYDPQRPKTYVIPNFRDLIATESVHPPAAYLIPAGGPGIADKLGQHGLRLERLATPATLHVERYRLRAPHWEEKPFEGRHVLGEFTLAARDEDAFATGAYLLPLDQRAANVAVTLLEPRATDSLLRWGFFDAIF